MYFIMNIFVINFIFEASFLWDGRTMHLMAGLEHRLWDI